MYELLERKPLETENDKIFMENKMLIYKVINDLNIRYLEDEIYDAGLIGFAKGLRDHENYRDIKLSTFLYINIKHEIVLELRKMKAKKRQCESLSLDTVIVEGSREMKLEDIISDNTSIEENYMRKDAIDTMLILLNRLSDKEKYVLENLYQIKGYKNQVELAEYYGVHQVTISRIKRSAIQKMKEMMSEYDFNI